VGLSSSLQFVSCYGPWGIQEAVRTMFVVYWLLIVGGVVVYAVVGRAVA
jgi:hypothetical protein